MRTSALLFCLILLVVATPSLLLLNLFQFSFHWSDALAYLLVAGVIYGLIAAVGFSLNKRFDTTVDEFLIGASSDLAPPSGLLRTFGLLLFVLLPYLLFSLTPVLRFHCDHLRSLWVLGSDFATPCSDSHLDRSGHCGSRHCRRLFHWHIPPVLPAEGADVRSESHLGRAAGDLASRAQGCC